MLFLTDCFVWFGEESVITFICHQRAGKNRGKKPLVTLVTNWAFLIKTDTKQRKFENNQGSKRKAFLSILHLSLFSFSTKPNWSFRKLTLKGWQGQRAERIFENQNLKRFPKTSIWIVQSRLNVLHSTKNWNKGVLRSFNSWQQKYLGKHKFALKMFVSFNKVITISSAVYYSLIKSIQFCENLVAAMQRWINGSMCIKIFHWSSGNAYHEIEFGQFVYLSDPSSADLALARWWCWDEILNFAEKQYRQRQRGQRWQWR